MRKKHLRLLTAVVAAVGALVLAGSAFATFSPSFTVSTDPNGTTTIGYQQASTDDTAGMLSFWVPSDVFANVSQPGGLAVGAASASVGGTSMTGSVAAATGTDTVPGGTGTYASAVAACNPGIPEPPAAFWLITLTGGGQTVQLPVFLFNVLETDPYGSFFIANVSLCPPASLKLTQLTLKVDEVFSVTPTWDLWHLGATPYGGTALNTAGTVEAESQDRTPHDVSATATKGKSPGTVLVTGKVKQGGVGMVGIAVNVLVGKKTVATTKTTTGGRYKIVAKTASKTVIAQATVPDRKSPKCIQPLFAPAPCVSSTISGFVGTSGPTPVA